MRKAYYETTGGAAISFLKCLKKLPHFHLIYNKCLGFTVFYKQQIEIYGITSDVSLLESCR